MNRPHVQRLSPSLRILPLLGLLALSASCASGLSVRSTHYTKDSLLLMPPLDGVEKGAERTGTEQGPGSGQRLFELLVGELRNRRWDVTAFRPNGEVGHGAPVTAEQALRFGRAAGKRYVMTVNLGDVRDVPPFTPLVSDHLDLDDARMYDCESGEVVWQLTRKYRRSASNATHVSGADWSIAVLIGRSLQKRAK